MDSRFIKSIRIDWQAVPRGSYLHDIAALHSFAALPLHENITFFAGENGTGKSTLLEAIAVASGFSAEGGNRNYHFSTYDSHSELCRAIRLTKGVHRPRNSYFLRAESFYNVASKAEEYRDDSKEVYYKCYGGKSLHEQSHGESFLALAMANFAPGGFYLLDEPEAALSAQRQLALLAQMVLLAQAGAQFIVASHSPILLGTPGAEILSFDDGKVAPCRYEDTGAYRVSEMFINRREKVLHELLTQEDVPEK